MAMGGREHWSSLASDDLSAVQETEGGTDAERLSCDLQQVNPLSNEMSEVLSNVVDCSL